MAGRPEGATHGRKAHVFRALALAGVSFAALAALPSSAQTQDTLAEVAAPQTDGQLLLQADQLIYDNDARTITAQGGVRLDYAGTRMVADRLVYVENGSRLVAIGNVEIVQPDGTRTFADEADVTDDFRDGFVNSLRVVTPDNTRFAAESAVRTGGTVTVFNNGIYTACEPCRDKPGRPPVWQIKSRKIIWNGNEKTVRFERASFEFLGIPLAGLPVFETADPTVKRKTGFLLPRFRFSNETGFGAGIPYFINLAPNRDLTLTGFGYTKQGFLAEAEFRHRLENGTYSLKIAGIHQMNPGAFASNTIDSTVKNRGMIGTKGDFRINPRWTFGWDIMAQTDRDFSRTYQIDDFNQAARENTIHLTGISGRNHFDARLLKFSRQTSGLTSQTDAEQPWVLPTVDYNYVVGSPVAGGELSFNANVRGISRKDEDERRTVLDSNFSTPGAQGQSWRGTVESEWKRDIVTAGGLVVTPMLHAQGDFTSYALTNTADSATFGPGNGITGTGSAFRGMVTAGLEMRWPILFSASGSKHVIEPVVQLFARPNEMAYGRLPNEDAQSLVFDATTLFQRDKFSGYDRIEGGHRANVGIRYTGTFANGWGAEGLFGQSYHLGGLNSYAQADAYNTGADSGLETRRSDYVGRFALNNGEGFQASVGGRFDETNFAIRRGEAGLSFQNDIVSLSSNYAFIAAQPTYGFTNDRHEVSANGSLRFAENWRVFGSATYDIRNQLFDKNTIGLAYDDECFSFRFAFSQDRTGDTAIQNNYSFQIKLRTIGDFGASDASLGL